MSDTCGCCAGTEKSSPAALANRPGLSALLYRVGTHATFLETMKARLSNLDIEVEGLDQNRRPVTSLMRPLLRLTTRDGSDPAIAILDAWAIVADVLTFYQERIANEGYLRTAVERRSILELARLVGYRLRPGVAASVYLAYELEKESEVTIPVGSRAQSVPGPDELPQSFETSEPLESRSEWNGLTPKQTRPQRISVGNAHIIDALYFKGTDTRLKANDPLLLVFGGDAREQVVRWVEKVEPLAEQKITRVTLQARAASSLLATPLNTIQQIATKYLNIEEFGVSHGAMADRIINNHLLPLHSVDANTIFPTLRTSLPQLEMEHRTAQREGYVRLEPWIDGLVTELSEVAEGMPRLAGGISTGSGSGDDNGDGNDGGDNDDEEDDDGKSTTANLERMLKSLKKEPSLAPSNALSLSRSISQAFAKRADVLPALLTTFAPILQGKLYQALGSAKVAEASNVEVYALRARAQLFGYNATPTRPLTFPPTTTATGQTGDNEWHVVEPVFSANSVVTGKTVHEAPNVVNLDASYDKIVPDSWIVVETVQTPLTTRQTLIAKARNPNASSARAVYGISGPSTRIELASPANPSDRTKDVNWITEDLDNIDLTTLPIAGDMNAVRTTSVHAESELLDLAEVPIDPVEEPVAGDEIELEALYGGLLAGRWLIISGERTDIQGVTGVEGTELVMLAGVRQGSSKASGDKIHSTIQLASKLSYRYKRDTVTIWGNVVKATHGETRTEALGSGDASQSLQEFTLRQSPLTYLSAPTAAGAQSTLQVRVNSLLWHESESLYGLESTDRAYLTEADDEDQTKVIFGNGVYGARLPTGLENVKAVYRTGIGKPGNVAAGQITKLATRPLGVKSVLNPLPATGGADREDRDQARRNVPVGLMALDRLVSVRDYEDFARTFAGIGKASSARLSNGRQRVVHLTIAGAEDIPIANTSDLYLNLREALRKLGDPAEPLQVAVRNLMLLVIGAKVRLLPDYEWESVEPQIRSSLLSAFGFNSRELGENVYLSEAVAAIQSVPGVAYVDVDTFDAINEDIDIRRLNTLAKSLGRKDAIVVRKAHLDPAAKEPSRRIRPAQMAYLSPDVPDTLLLAELSA